MSDPPASPVPEDERPSAGPSPSEADAVETEPTPPPKLPVARTVLGTTLAIFFTITGTGAAFQATCFATTVGASSLPAGVAVGLIAALITAGVMIRILWMGSRSS
jgi:hypothetical protein